MVSVETILEKPKADATQAESVDLPTPLVPAIISSLWELM